MGSRQVDTVTNSTMTERTKASQASCSKQRLLVMFSTSCHTTMLRAKPGMPQFHALVHSHAGCMMQL
jgi:hypothetical protein